MRSKRPPISTQAFYKANNMIIVGPNCRYTSTSSAATHATAMGMSATNPYLVLYYPGAIVDHADADGLTVLPVSQFTGHETREGFVPAPTDMTVQRVPTVYGDTPLVVIRADDGLVSWLTTPTSGDAATTMTLLGEVRSPQHYARLQGEPISHAIVPQYIEDGTTGLNTVVSKTQLWSMYMQLGCDLMAHTYQHKIQPSTYEIMLQETQAARDYIEALTVAGKSIEDIGAVCRAWIQSGDWTIPSGSSIEPTNVNHWRALLVRATYEVSQAYAGRNIVPAVPTSPDRPHCYGVSVSYAYASDAAFRAVFNPAVAPTGNIIVGMHGLRTETGFVGDHASYDTMAMPLATFKVMIDCIKTWVDNGWAHAVTLPMLVASEPVKRIYYQKALSADPETGVITYATTLADGSDADPYEDSVPNGDFQAALSGTWTVAAGVALEEDAGPDGAGDDCIKFAAATDWARLSTASDAVTVTPGRVNLLSFDLKASNVDARVGVYLTYRLIGGTSAEIKLSYTNDPGWLRPASTDWHKVRLPFGVPSSCNGKMTLALDKGNGRDVWVDNFRVEPV